MNQLQFHPKARAELEKSAIFYDEKFPGLGSEFATEVQTAVAFAFSHPEAGTPVSSEFRALLSAGFHFQSCIAPKAPLSTSSQ